MAKMLDPVSLLITISTTLGPISTHTELVERRDCPVVAARIEQDSAFRAAHDGAVRGWVVRAECGR